MLCYIVIDDKKNSVNDRYIYIYIITLKLLIFVEIRFVILYLKRIVSYFGAKYQLFWNEISIILIILGTEYFS